jgi:hypothetical protein
MKQKPSELTEVAMMSRLWAYYELLPEALKDPLAGIAEVLVREAADFPPCGNRPKTGRG